MKLWKDAKRTNAQALLDWLLSIKQPNGWPVNLDSMITFSELAASSIPSSNLDDAIIMMVLTRMSEQNKTSVEDFEEIFTEYKREQAIKRQTSTDLWHFYIPLDISLDKEIRLPSTIKVFGREFRFMTRRMTTKHLEEGAFAFLKGLRLLNLLTSDLIPDFFLSAIGRGDSWTDAWQELEPAFDTLRGIMEITFSFGRWQIMSDQKPRRKVPHPRWLVARLGDQEAEGVRFIVDDLSVDQSFPISKNDFTAIKRNALLLKREPAKGSTLEIVADCFRLYTQAMDARWSYSCFLSLWQLAEAITLSETVGGQTDKVCERLVWHTFHTQLKGSGLADTLKVFAKKRNDIVHRGIHNVNDDDINIMKYICEMALSWLVKARHEIPTASHLNHFYRLREINDSEFEALKDSVRNLDTQRKHP